CGSPRGAIPWGHPARNSRLQHAAPVGSWLQGPGVNLHRATAMKPWKACPCLAPRARGGRASPTSSKLAILLSQKIIVDSPFKKIFVDTLHRLFKKIFVDGLAPKAHNPALSSSAQEPSSQIGPVLEHTLGHQWQTSRPSRASRNSFGTREGGPRTCAWRCSTGRWTSATRASR